MMIKLLTLPLIALSAIPTQCSAPPNERPAQEIFIPEDYPFPFRAESGDTLIAILDPIGDMATRCDNMGGELRRSAHTDLFLCWEIDF